MSYETFKHARCKRITTYGSHMNLEESHLSAVNNKRFLGWLVAVGTDLEDVFAWQQDTPKLASLAQTEAEVSALNFEFSVCYGHA